MQVANILFIDQYATLGGGQRILVDLATAFVKAGHRATVLFPGRGEDSGGEVTEILRGSGVETGSYALTRLKSGRKSPIEGLRYLATAGRSARSIKAACRGKGFDLLYVNGPRAILPGVLAGRRLGLPVVAAVHLIHEGAERRLLAWCFGRPHVRLVSFCSRFAAAPFPKVGAKGRVQPNWVAPGFLHEPSHRERVRAELGLGAEDLAIGVLGRVSKTKGQRLFLEAALPLLGQGERGKRKEERREEGQHPDPELQTQNSKLQTPGSSILNPQSSTLHLLMAGSADFEDPQEEQALKALAAPYGDRVRFLGKIPATDFLDALDISVVPSVRPEAFGLVAIESMARRLPVVATRLGGLQDTVVDGETGFLVGPDAGAMGRALAKLIGDGELRARMAEAGRRRAESDYSPEILIPRAMEALLGSWGVEP